MAQFYPLLTIEEARAYEAAVFAGSDAETMEAMINAGEAIGIGILNDYLEIREWPEYPQVLVLAGKGLNTGDALVACSLMRHALTDLQVTVVMTEPEDQLHPFASAALDKLRAELLDDLELLSVEDYLGQEPVPYDVVMDGLYGHGFRPPLGQPAAELLQHVNSRTDILLKAAVDLPSGMGGGVDPDCFVADFTYIPGVAKAPCFDPQNAHLVGRLRFLEIEPFLDQPIAGKTRLVASPTAHAQLNQLRPAQSDKRTYGHCLILAGSGQMPGAAIMATLGALYAGAGLVTTCTAGDVGLYNASAAPEAMWRALPTGAAGGLHADAFSMVMDLADRCQVLLAGPGLMLCDETVAVINAIITKTALPLVLDASALVPAVVEALSGRPADAGPVVLTPHLGEFARLSGVSAASVSDSELRAFCSKYHTITLLKGSPARIADDKRCCELPVGGPVLARGGSGDILAGMLAALLARCPDDPLMAAVQAVSWHGAAADELARDSGSTAVRTTDLLAYLSSSLRA